MGIKEAKEIIKAGFAWANWTEEQKQAMRIAYKSMDELEEIKKYCTIHDEKKTKIRPIDILNMIN